MLLQSRMRLQQLGVLVLEARVTAALGVQVQLAAFEAAVRFGEAVLQHPLEARLGVALLAAPPLAAARAVVQQQASERQGSGNDGPTAEGMPHRVAIHRLLL